MPEQISKAFMIVEVFVAVLVALAYGIGLAEAFRYVDSDATLLATLAIATALLPLLSGAYLTYRFLRWGQQGLLEVGSAWWFLAIAGVGVFILGVFGQLLAPAIEPSAYTELHNGRSLPGDPFHVLTPLIFLVMSARHLIYTGIFALIAAHLWLERGRKHAV